MSRIILSFLLCCISSVGWTDTSCFMVQDNGKRVAQEGDCTTPRTPSSSFKLALSVIGYDAGILLDETHPKIPFKKGYPDYKDIWRQPHTPKLWMKNSCLWYSQYITHQLGAKKLKAYLEKLHYGNTDITGDKGESNGLKRSWISSSLEISPKEQLRFVADLKDNKLPLSVRAQIMTKSIMTSTPLANGWTLYAKTGSAWVHHPRTNQKTKFKQGWSVGWVTKGPRTLVFVYYVKEDHYRKGHAGARATQTVIEKLQQFIGKVDEKIQSP